MRAQRMIEGAAFGPEVLQILRRAFDDAWASVADKFAEHDHESAREALAIAMMSATRSDSADVGRLRELGIRAMQQLYPTRFGDIPSGKGTKIG